MIRLKVNNYQSVRDADLQIKGLTILKGESNSGKSSIFKAFYSATHNRFRTGCVTFGEDACTVRIKYSDSPHILSVVRSQSGASPKVRLGNKEDGYLTFDKLNREVPKEVLQFNNFGKVDVSSADSVPLNFVSQFTPPLLLQFSP